MTGLAPVAPKLSKLLPRLASDHDGEVVATVRAIGRTLSGAGLDFHALADAVSAPPARLDARTRRSSPARGAAFSAEGSPLADALYCLKSKYRLKERDADFVEKMARQLRDGGEASEKQAKWLRDIVFRIREGRA